MNNHLIIGFFILNLLCSITTIWGFFSMYLRNYYYFYNSNLVNSIPQIIICLTFAIWACNVILPFLIMNLSSNKIFSISLLGKCLCYILIFLVNHSWQIYLCAFFINFFESLLVFASLYYIVGIFKQKKGKYSGIALSGIGINVLFWSNFMIFYTNPENISPNDNNIFNKKIADNFYSYVIFYTIINFIFGIIGIYLLKDMNEENENSIKSNYFSKKSISEKSISQISETYQLKNLINYRYESQDDYIELGSVKSRKKIIKKEIGIQTNLSEKEKLYKNLYSKKFLTIFYIACIRSGFFFYSSSNFKFIALTYIKNDQFVSFTSSLFFVFDIFSRIIVGSLLDKISVKNIILGIFFFDLIIILIWIFFPGSYFFYVIICFLIRSSSGANSIINYIVLYKYYEKDDAFKLMTYFSVFFFSGIILNTIIEKIFFVNGNYSNVLFIDLILIVSAIIVLYKENYKMI